MSGLKKHCGRGGIFLAEFYRPEQLNYKTGGPQDPDFLIPLAELQKAFAGFEIIYAAEPEEEIHEGDFHTGKACLTQFIARKR